MEVMVEKQITFESSAEDFRTGCLCCCWEGGQGGENLEELRLEAFHLEGAGLGACRLAAYHPEAFRREDEHLEELRLVAFHLEGAVLRALGRQGHLEVAAVAVDQGLSAGEAADAGQEEDLVLSSSRPIQRPSSAWHLS